METEKVPSFLKMCASPCSYSGNRFIEEHISFNSPPTSLFSNVHDPLLHEETSKNEDIFESLTENVSVSTIKTFAGLK